MMGMVFGECDKRLAAYPWQDWLKSDNIRPHPPVRADFFGGLSWHQSHF